jgi:hypothetical protein
LRIKLRAVKREISVQRSGHRYLLAGS